MMTARMPIPPTLPTTALALVLAFSLTAIAIPDPTLAREPIAPTELARITGMDKALDGVAAGIAVQGDQLAAEGEAIGGTANFAATWKKVADAAFAPAKLKAAFAARLAGKLSATETNTIEDFYRSDLGQRLVAAEVASGSEAGQQEMIAQARQIMEKLSADPARRKVLDEIVAATRLNDMSTVLAINMSRAIMIGLATADKTGSRMTMEDIVNATEQQRAEVSTQMDAVVTLSLAHAYRDIPASDLQSYATFLSKPEGRKFSGVVLNALDAVMSEAGLSFGKQLATELGREPI